jgi:sugar lactone lactonase YvrE
LLYGFCPYTLEVEVHSIGQKVGCVALTKSERLLLATEFGFAFYQPGDPPPQNFCNVIPLGSGNMFNDGKISPDGAFWVGSKGPAGTSRLYSLDQDLCFTTVIDGLSISNGIGWSQDGCFFYHTDSFDRHIYRYTTVNNALTRREIFYTPPTGTPDGLTIDSDGNIWTALWDGSRVIQLSPEGFELAEILLPVSRPTSVSFGGADLRTLFITSASVDLSAKELSTQPYAGDLFSIRLPNFGLPENRFKLHASPL